MRKLHEIFVEQSKLRDFNNGQTVDFILPRLGVTLAVPHHREVLFKSCHKHAAMQMRAMMEKGEIDAFESDNIKIRLLGSHTTGKVYHTIVVDTGKDPENVIIDSLGAEDTHNSYYDENGDYWIKLNPQSDTHFKLDLMKEISVPDFREKYIDPIYQPRHPDHTP